MAQECLQTKLVRMQVVHVAEGEKSADAAEFFLALGVQDTSAVVIAPAAAAGTDAAAAAAPAAADARLYRVRDCSWDVRGICREVYCVYENRRRA